MDLLDEQVEVHVLPGGAGKRYYLDLALGGSINHGLDFGTGTEGFGTEDVDVTGQQGSHGGIGVRIELNDNLFDLGGVAIVIFVGFKGHLLTLFPSGNFVWSVAPRLFGNFGQGWPIFGGDVGQGLTLVRSIALDGLLGWSWAESTGVEGGPLHARQEYQGLLGVALLGEGLY